MKLIVLLILAVFASEKKEDDTENNAGNEKRIGNNEEVVVKIEEDEYVKVNKKPKYIGVSYVKRISKWQVQRRSKNKNAMVYNGYFNDEETAAHASDTLARELMKNGEEGHKLNFPDDHTEVYPEKHFTSKFIGVSYYETISMWYSRRWSTKEKQNVSNGYYDDEKTAAHASDNLARKVMENGDQKLKLNFPDDHIEVYPSEKHFTSKFIGVSFNKKESKWRVRRMNKNGSKQFSNGYYDDEETAAHASDTLARKLMESGELKLRLNFPDDHTEVYPEKSQNKKRKRPNYSNLGHPQNN